MPRAETKIGPFRTYKEVMRALLVCLVVLTPLAAHAQSAVATPMPPSLGELVAHLDDDPDPLHADYTPAVWALADRGFEAAVAVLPLLDAPEAMTRLHASRVLEGVLARHFGWRAGQGYPTGSDGEARFRRLWSDNGSYAYDAPAAERQRAIARWRTWLEAHRHDPAVALEPTGESLRAALREPLRTAHACLPAATPPIRIRADLTFVASGATSRVRVHDADGPVARCVERALRATRVPPFLAPEHTIAISVMGR